MNVFAELRKLNESMKLYEHNRTDLKKFVGDEVADKFFKMKQLFKSPYNDLNYWINKGDPEALSQYMSDFEAGKYKSNTQKKKEEKIEGSKLVFDDKGWKTYHITTYNAAKRLGSGTTWCITGRYEGEEDRGEFYFDDYIRRYDLDGYYFIFDTENRDKTTGDYLKYCAGVNKSGRIQFLYNGMKDDDIFDGGIPNIPEDRQVQMVPDIKIRFRQSPKDYLKITKNIEEEEYVTLNVKKVDIDCEIIGPQAFDGSMISEVTLSDKVKEIGRRAFFDCPKLNKITFGNNITRIDDLAFKGCDRLTTIHIPDSVTYIGTMAFELCERLTSIILSKNLTEIANYLFSYCKKLTTIDIPDGVTKIGVYAFQDCDNLSSIRIPNSVKEIGKDAFSGIKNLTIRTDNKFVINYCKKNDIKFDRFAR